MILWRLLLLALFAHTSGFRTVCYYTNWSQNRRGKGAFVPEYVDAKLCTHIVFAFVDPAGLGFAICNANDEEMYARLIKAKKKNSKLKILLAYGGGVVKSDAYSQLAITDSNREAFSKNAVKYLRQRNFDGFDMDWEHPGYKEKEMFALLIQKMRQVFEDEAKETGKARLELSVTVGAGKWTIDSGLDIPKLTRYADFLNIMTYDFHGSWSKVTGFCSPLYAHPSETGDERRLNVDWVLKYLVSLGAPTDKLHAGIASYGRSFTLSNPSVHNVLSPSRGPGNPTTYLNERGFASYYEICDIIKYGGKVWRDESQGNPYMVRGDQWFGYDDVESVTKKAWYLKNNSYGGILLWTLDYDDFASSSCKQGSYPLLTAVNKVFFPEMFTKFPTTHTTPTDAPATYTPPTDAPPTDAPPTDAQPTDAPPTKVTPIDFPPNNAPPSNVLITGALASVLMMLLGIAFVWSIVRSILG